MKYLLSIENNYYHRWQTELLIESFKYHSIADDLCIFISNKDNATTNNYVKNIISHKNKHFHVGEKDVYLNKINCLKYVIEHKMLDFPICLIHPDMVLQNPIKANSEKDILFSYNPDRDSFFDDIEKEIIKQIDSRPKFIPFGNVVLFNNINLDFLNNLYHNYVNFSKRDVYKARRYSWIYTLTQNSYGLLKDCFSLGVEEFEQTLLHHNLTNNFIHYQHGLGSDWNKYQFKRPDVLLGTSGPYDSFLSSEITTSSTEYLKKIINNYLND
jgi:hypothetical protein